jgi:hypothetical protein
MLMKSTAITGYERVQLSMDIFKVVFLAPHQSLDAERLADVCGLVCNWFMTLSK